MTLAQTIKTDILQIFNSFKELSKSLLDGPGSANAIWRACYSIGNRSVFFVLVTIGFLGAILNLQAGYQAQRIVGDATMVGEQLMPALIRQLAPTLSGLMIATRVGSGLAAELGTMAVTEQLDAYRLCGAPIIETLVKPRCFASLIMIPLLMIFGGAAAFIAGLGIAVITFDTLPATYANFDQVSSVDIAECVCKSVVYAIVLPVIACTAGIHASGGSDGVGRATTRAVVESSLAVLILDFLIGITMYLFK